MKTLFTLLLMCISSVTFSQSCVSIFTQIFKPNHVFLNTGGGFGLTWSHKPTKNYKLYLSLQTCSYISDRSGNVDHINSTLHQSDVSDFKTSYSEKLPIGIALGYRHSLHTLNESKWQFNTGVGLQYAHSGFERQDYLFLYTYRKFLNPNENEVMLLNALQQLYTNSTNFSGIFLEAGINYKINKHFTIGVVANPCFGRLHSLTAKVTKPVEFPDIITYRASYTEYFHDKAWLWYSKWPLTFHVQITL